jgi:cytochrome c6
MKKVLAGTIVAAGISLFVINGFADEKTNGKIGETDFNEHCVVCHPGGKNVFNRQKTLFKKDLEANNIRTTEDIIKIMRNPGPNMTKFDEYSIPEKEAKEIAKYILETFK